MEQSGYFNLNPSIRAGWFFGLFSGDISAKYGMLSLYKRIGFWLLFRSMKTSLSVLLASTLKHAFEHLDSFERIWISIWNFLEWNSLTKLLFPFRFNSWFNQMNCSWIFGMLDWIHNWMIATSSIDRFYFFFMFCSLAKMMVAHGIVLNYLYVREWFENWCSDYTNDCLIQWFGRNWFIDSKYETSYRWKSQWFMHSWWINFCFLMKYF